MANKQPFDETLYRLVEHDDAAASAAELKTRIDGEPEFAAAFDRTRKTVLSLQGMGPKPADRAVGTFTQRDFDRLTKGILKSYRTKLSDLYLVLGKAYLHQESEKYVGLLGRDTDPKEEQALPRVQRARESFRSVGGESDSLSLEGRSFKALRPVKKSLICFQAGRSMAPRSSTHRIWEGMSFLHAGDLSQAQEAFSIASEVGNGWTERKVYLEAQSVLEFVRGDHRRQVELVNAVLEAEPLSAKALNNLGMALFNLGELQKGVVLFEGLFSRASFESGVKEVCTCAFAAADHWSFFQKEPALFDRFVRAARVHLGDDVSSLIERVGL